MSSDPQAPPDTQETSDSRELQDVVLHLDFVPTWARKPAENPYAGVARRDEREAPSRPGRDRGGPRGGRDRGERRRGTPHARKAERRPLPGPARRERLPIEVAFIPERRQLGAIVKQLHASQKAFPLPYVASLLLGKPEFHLLKLEIRPGRGGQAGLRLFQCSEDGAIFPDVESFRAHAIAAHLDPYFEAQDVQTEPPSGNFTCVGRCRLSGELLGPPNYHGYNERVIDLQRTRFPHLSLDEYRGHIEVVRDPAVIEQWKESCRTQRVYRPKGQPDAAPIKREEAVALFLQKRLPALQRTGTRFIVPAETVRDMPSGPLRTALEEAWARENRFPFTLMLALRPAFRHLRLHLFKAGRGETFVTAIHPRPLDTEHAVEPIRSMLRLIREHPGWSRAQLVEHLSPGTTLDSEAAAELLNPLRWLIDKGHVIEFFNGTLSAPALPSRETAADGREEARQNATAEETRGMPGESSS